MNLPKNRSSKRSGFTLIELMVAISIVAILATVGLVILGNTQKSARDSKRRADLKDIATALEQYKIITGSYPNRSWVYSDGAQPWIPELTATYMKSIPIDPKNSGGAPHAGGYTYGYYATSYCPAIDPSCNWFMLVAHMESPNASDNASKCTAPDGSSFHYPNSYMVCNSQ